ncbi:hypothetical protein ACLKA7_015375 [Drosophila subpalustris]
MDMESMRPPSLFSISASGDSRSLHVSEVLRQRPNWHAGDASSDSFSRCLVAAPLGHSNFSFRHSPFCQFFACPPEQTNLMLLLSRFPKMPLTNRPLK